VAHIQVDGLRVPGTIIITDAAAATAAFAFMWWHLLLLLLFVAAAIPEVGVLQLHYVSLMSLN